MRRCSLDLIGTPPELAEMEDYLRDDSPGAYEKDGRSAAGISLLWRAVGPVLAKCGRLFRLEGLIDEDLFRLTWRYRDYVIRSFNNDKLYDQFLTEQIAATSCLTSRR
jgi:hypothetical protein